MLTLMLLEGPPAACSQRTLLWFFALAPLCTYRLILLVYVTYAEV